MQKQKSAQGSVKIYDKGLNIKG